MKRFLLFLTLLFPAFWAFAQNTADFHTMKTGTTYGTYTSTAGWTAANAQVVKIGDYLAPTLNGKTSTVGTLTSPTLRGGLGKITFSYQNTYKESNGVSVKIEIKQNNNVVKTETLTNKNVTQSTEYKFESQAFNVEDDFVIVITNLCPTNKDSNGDRVSIYNLSWTSYTGGGEPKGDAPTYITFTPEDGSSISTTDQISLESDGETINYSIDNETYTETYSTPFTLSAGEHTVYAKASNDAGNFTASAKYTVTAPEPGEETFSTTINAKSFNYAGSSYELKSFKDDYGFTYHAVFSASGDDIQFNLGNKNGGAGSALAVTAFNPEYIISHIEISKTGFNVYSYSKAMPEPVKSTAYATPNDATKVTENNGKFEINNNAFAIVPPSGAVQFSLTVYYKKVEREPAVYEGLKDLENFTLAYNGTKTINLGSERPEINFTFKPEGVVTVSEEANGDVTFTAVTDGLSVQTTDVTASWGDDKTWAKDSKTFTITVEKLEKKDYTAPFADKEYTFTMGQTDGKIELGDNPPTITFTDPKGLVEIDDKGNVTVNKAGETTVTATWSESESWHASPNDGVTFTVIVNKKTYEFGFATELNLYPDDTATLYEGENLPEFKIEETENEGIVTIDGATVTANTIGTATLTLTWGDETYADGTATVTINVTKRPTLVAKTDVLTKSNIGFDTTTSYIDWEYTSQTTGITYKGNSAGSDGSIQMTVRDTSKGQSNSGVVVTDNPDGYVLKSISVKWHSSTLDARQLDVYCSNAPYTSIDNLYSTNDAGAKVVSFKKSDGDATFTDFNGEYQYVGFRSNGSALYLSEVTLIWEKEEEPELGDIVIAVNDTDVTEEITTEESYTGSFGDVFTFSAENATDITVTVDEEPADGNFENGVYTWTISNYYDAAYVEVTAKNDTDTKSIEFLLKIPAPKLGEVIYTVTGEKQIKDESITVDFGDVFTFSAENATDITVTVNDEPANGKFENGVYTWTINKYYDEAIVEVVPYLGETAGEDMMFELTVNAPKVEHKEEAGVIEVTVPANHKLYYKFGIWCGNGFKPDAQYRTLSTPEGFVESKSDDEYITITPSEDKDGMNVHKFDVDGFVKRTTGLEEIGQLEQGEVLHMTVITEDEDGDQSPEQYIGVENTGETSGVGSVEADGSDESNAVYYNLQGVRVGKDSLTPGVYVRVAGGTATKVHVRQ